MSTIGINLTGAENGGRSAYPGEADLDYFGSHGISLVRLPLSWERLQPRVWGELDPAELARVQNFLTLAADRGVTVILDLHSYGRYDGVPIGSAEVPTAAFAEFWGKFATVVAGLPALGGYGLMNEPHDMGGVDIWPKAAQAAVNAIRTVDTATQILVAGDNWGGAHSWQDNNGSLSITDPAGNLAYEAHLFLDHDNSGTYRGTYDEQGAYPMLGVDRLTPFLEWLDRNNARGFIGEFGAPDDDPRWTAVIENLVEALYRNGVPGAYWLAGSGSEGNPLSVQPTGGTDSIFLDVLSRYARLPALENFDETLRGGAGDDQLLGYAGNDHIYGLSGLDQLHGHIGNDVIGGGDGDDKLSGGAGDDVESGGVGNDTVEGGSGHDRVGGDAGRDIIGGQSGNDRLNGGIGADSLWGDDGDDTLAGGTEDDWLDGGLGNDLLHGNDGADRLDARDGSDTLDGGAGGDELNGEGDSDILFGRSGNDLLSGNTGDDRLYGGFEDDTLRGSEGRDRLLGEDGQDALYGEGGLDTLRGGAGNDWIEGQAGNDVLAGDAGSDRFVFGRGEGRDTVLDFDPSDGDRLDLQDQSYALRNIAAGLELTLSGGGSVVISRLSTADLHPDWFV